MSSKQYLGYLWLVPFIGFTIGYIVAGHFLQRKELIAPNVIGKPLQESIEVLSDVQLGTRLLGQREEASLAEGIVLDQIPHPGQKIRPHQNVFITISVKKRKTIGVPDFWGKKYREALELATSKGFELEVHYLMTANPRGMCVAQTPAAGDHYADKKIKLFFSTAASSCCIMPDLKGLVMADIEQRLHGYDVRAEFLHEQQQSPDHSCTACKVVDQRPTPGSIVDLSKTLHIQLILS